MKQIHAPGKKLLIIYNRTEKNSNKRASGRKLGNSSEWRKQFSLEGTKKYTKGRGCAGKRADPGTEVRI